MMSLALSLVLNLALGAPPSLRGPDFNGDGHEDSAVSAPGKSVDGVEDGAVMLLYGSDLGLAAAMGQTAQLDMGVSGPDAPPIDGAHFGSTLTWGDFDGDCYDDLVVGVPDVKVEYHSSIGGAVVFPGGPEGPSAGRAVWLDPTDVYAPFVVSSGSGYGSSLAAADFDADGVDDLAVGAPSYLGQVQVLYGGDTPLPVQIFDNTHPNVEPDAANIGMAMASGDFNCDGFGDLAMSGAPDESGAILVAYGSASGLDGSAAWPLEVLNHDVPGFAHGSTGFDHIRTMASGNFDDNAEGDIACDDLVFVVHDLGRVHTAAGVGLLAGQPAEGIALDTYQMYLWTPRPQLDLWLTF